jgi:hypothetical protein
VGERKPADGYFVGRGRYVSRSGLRKIIAPDERPSRRIKRAATLASDSDVSRSGPREKPRGLFGRAPLGSGGIVPAGPVPPIASVGERKPADGYFVGRERYVPGSGLREIIALDERPSRRIKRAATLASDSDVVRSGPTEKPRGLRPRPASAPAPLAEGLHLPARRSPMGFALSSRAHIKYSVVGGFRGTCRFWDEFGLGLQTLSLVPSLGAWVHLTGERHGHQAPAVLGPFLRPHAGWNLGFGRGPLKTRRWMAKSFLSITSDREKGSSP